MDLKIDDALKRAIEAHEAGALQVAEKLYAAILKVQPKHPQTNHNLGVMAANTGNFEVALVYFKIAIDNKPDIAQFWVSYINALIKTNHLEQAKMSLEQTKNKGFQDDRLTLLSDRIVDLMPSQTIEQSNPSAHVTKNILEILNLNQALNLAKKKLEMVMNLKQS